MYSSQNRIQKHLSLMNFLLLGSHLLVLHMSRKANHRRKYWSDYCKLQHPILGHQNKVVLMHMSMLSS